MNGERTSPISSRLPRRRWIYAGSGVLLLLIIVFVIAPLVIAHIAKTKLQALVQKQMNATLVVGGCSYHMPYGLTLRNARLIVHDKNGGDSPLLSVDRLEIRLAALPRDDQPLRIEQLVVRHPVLHLHSSAHESFDLHDLMHQREETGPSKKPSDVFQLSRLDLTAGQVVYNGQSLDGLNIKATLDAHQRSQYAYMITAAGPGIRAESTGKFDIDQLLLHAATASVAVNTDSTHSLDFLPADLQQRLTANDVGGAADLTGSGEIPLNHLNQAKFSAQVHLDELRADNPRWPAPLDDLAATLGISRDDAEHPITAKITEFRAVSGPATMQIRSGTVMADPDRRTWSMTELAGVVEGEEPAATSRQSSELARTVKHYTILGRVEFTAAAHGVWPQSGQLWPHTTYKILAYARDASFLIPHAEAPIDRINGGPMLFTDRDASVQNLSAHYGHDVLQIFSSTLHLTRVDAGLGVSALDADVTFDRNSPRYPQPIARYMNLLHPQGELHAVGKCLVFLADHQPRYDCDLTVTSPDVSFAVGDALFPLDHAKLAVSAKGNELTLTKFDASSFGGKISANAQMRLQQPITASGEATFQNIDVRAAYTSIAGRGGQVGVQPNQRISGQASGDVHAAITGSDWHAATANGDVEIAGGNFGNIPILSQLAAQVHLSDSAFTGSEAAAVFNVGQQTVSLANVAISSPAIGIEGDGYIRFNGLSHLHVIIAPLADWRTKLKSLGIPILGDIAGTAQMLINHATRLLLYEFNVTGDIQNPKVMPVPFPILTKKSGRLFSHMLKSKPEEDLLEELRIIPTTNP